MSKWRKKKTTDESGGEPAASPVGGNRLATGELMLGAGQADRLETAVLQARNVPLYAAYPFPETNLLEGLSSLPLIDKDDIRRSFPANFLRDPDELTQLLASGQAELDHTSGTSHERTPLILPTGWWRAQELRALRLNSVVAAALAERPEPRRVTITSPSCNGDVSYAGTPSCLERVVGGTLYVALSRLPFLWGPRDLERIARETLEWDPVFLDADPVYASVLARFCEREGIRFPRLRFIVCSYEYLSVAHRRLLGRVFKVPVFNLYGSTETGHLLMETTSGTFRPALETAALEVLKTDVRGIGDLVVTTLSNPLMPLLRYFIGDLVSRQVDGHGATYVLHGRAADAFKTTTASRVTARDIDECFADVPGVMHYQIRQQASHFEMRYISDGSRTGPDTNRLRRSLEEVLVDAPVTVTETDLLMPENSGKFRLCMPRPV